MARRRRASLGLLHGQCHIISTASSSAETADREFGCYSEIETFLAERESPTSARFLHASLYMSRDDPDSWIKFNSRQGERVLSNFHPGVIVVNGRKYHCGEAAFQGEKFLHVSDQTTCAEAQATLQRHAATFLTITEPRTAKLLGGRRGMMLRREQLRSWDGGGAFAIQMRICLEKMRTDVAVREVLQRTRARPLLHQDNRATKNTVWGGKVDKISGAVIGRNMLGLCWQRARKTPSSPVPSELCDVAIGHTAV